MFISKVCTHTALHCTCNNYMYIIYEYALLFNLFNSDVVNMELESNSVPIETPFQSIQYSHLNSHNQLEQPNDQQIDSKQQTSEGGDFPSSLGTKDTLHHHGDETVREKSFLVEGETVGNQQANSDIENSLQRDGKEVDKYSNNEHDVVQSTSSSEAAPELKLNQKSQDEGEIKSSLSHGHGDSLEGREEKADSEVNVVEQSSNRVGSNDKVIESHPASMEDSERGGELKQQDFDVASSSKTEDAQSVRKDDMNIHEVKNVKEAVTDKGDKMADSLSEEASPEVVDSRGELSRGEGSELSSSRVEGKTEGEGVGELSEGVGGVNESEGAEQSETSDVDDDMMTFEEFKQKKMEEGETNGGV